MSKDKYPSIFSPQMEAIVFIILFYATARSFENWGISSDIPQFYVRPRDAFRPIARERKYLMDYNLGYFPVFDHVTNLDQSCASEII